ncbi:low molecular weight protein-tyrosine-phosphatase [Halopseudomonas salegens]|uniref:protein-tyrosine-phosphatase n=1 Tax=Halopseudomonas salegens TaxID=1434072 RepID=A0A1H2EYG2_9GAMM|nr:low molecular weight protein-tyrosine-phosphatase [Halopseudomonas salegens]SDU00023.1 protein tyrosine phosphatase [Halopseudomonas salegens]
MKVLFVCLGNICRSPSAEGVFRQRLAQRSQPGVSVDSAGTAGYHVGKAPDPRAVAAARKRGIDISGLRARQVSAEDFSRFDLILAMDRSNLTDLHRLDPGNGARLRLFMEYAPDQPLEVPDPYYGGEQGFEQVLDMLEQASDALLNELQATC